LAIEEDARGKVGFEKEEGKRGGKKRREKEEEKEEVEAGREYFLGGCRGIVAGRWGCCCLFLPTSLG
jgi:hypothetical protein